MKKIYLLITITVFLLICSKGIQAQNAQTKLNQIELMKQFLGTWQANMGKDTVEVWEGQLYGNAVTLNVYQVIKGKKVPSYMNYSGLDSKDGKLKGFILNYDASNTTWIGSFTTDKNFGGDLLENFNPEKAWSKFDFVFVNPKEFLFTLHNMEGVKIEEFKFSKAN
jgi:hypothetical protein